MSVRRFRDVCEHVVMLAVCFFLLWNVFYMTEAPWTFGVRGLFPAVWLGLAGAALVMCRLKPGAAYAPLLALPAWMLLASAYRGTAVLQAQWGQIARAVLAFGVMLPAARIVRRECFTAYLKAALALWMACMTLQAAIGLWAALTGHAVFSLKGTWYIGVNLGDHRLYLNAFVTTGAVKMGLSVLLAALSAAAFRPVWAKGCFILAALVQLTCLSLTDCRTAFIAVGAGLGLMAFAGLAWRLPRQKLRGWLLAAAAMPVGAAAAYIGLSVLLEALGPHVPQVLDNLSLPEIPLHLLPHAGAEGAVQHRALQASNLFNDRQIIWQAALNLLREQPRFLLTGTTMALSSGLTNAMIPAGVYAGPDFVHVHSIYLQTLVAWGIPGFALLAAGLLAFAGAAWRVMVRHGGLSLWERLAPVPVLYVVLCETVDCFTRLAEDSPLLLFACVFAGWTLQLDASARRRAYLAKPARGAVDVIIPVYNAADYVARAALSALEAGAARVILVDDGSTDGSGAVCDRLAEDRRIVALHQENRGAAAARNAGLAAADAEYVAFLDADDRLLPGALTALLERMGDAQMIQGSIVRSDPEIYRKYPAEVLTGREALSRSLSDPTRLLLCHGWLFRRDLLTDRFDETLTLGEDGEWMLRVLRGTDKAALTEMPVYRYTVRADSALRSHTGAAAAYLQTLERTATTLEALKMPQETALYRLTHLLLMLTHDAAADGRTLREAAPFAADFERVRLQGFSPRMVTLRLLRRRAYPAVHLALRCRRIVNRIYGMHGKS